MPIPTNVGEASRIGGLGIGYWVIGLLSYWGLGYWGLGSGHVLHLTTIKDSSPDASGEE